MKTLLFICFNIYFVSMQVVAKKSMLTKQIFKQITDRQKIQRKIVNIYLSICFGCSKELSQ